MNRSSPLNAHAETIGQNGQPRPRRVALVYGAMVVAAIVLFLVIDVWGHRLAAPDGAASAAKNAGGAPQFDALPHVLLALVAVVVTGRLLGVLFRRIGQPPVIAEVVAGILLGPSLLGWLWPEAMGVLLPPQVAPFLAVIAQLGVILYMFLVGMELNLAVLRGRAHAALAISHASIIAPFVLGAGLALFLYTRLSSQDVPFTSFALFLGVAMAITAFPVLARILTDRGIQHSRLGIMALVCAAIGDVTAWCLLALLVGVAQAQVGGALVVIAVTILYVALVFLVVRPIAKWLLAERPEERLTTGVIATVFATLLLSALVTEAIGIHAIFGAFLFGAVIPHDSTIARLLTRQLESVVTILLLPAFFALTGMRTEIGLVSGAEQWLICALIIVVAIAGKFGGTFVPARLTGLPTRESAALGILMNTRGLMELIVLNIGLDLGVISPTLFAMMVLMALVTTFMTSPILRWLLRGVELAERRIPRED